MYKHQDPLYFNKKLSNRSILINQGKAPDALMFCGSILLLLSHKREGKGGGLGEGGGGDEEVEFSWTQCYLWYLSHRGRAKASRRNTECQVLLRQHRRRVGGAHGGQLRVSGDASFSSSWARLCGWLCRNQYYGAAQGNSTRSLSLSTLQ